MQVQRHCDTPHPLCSLNFSLSPLSFSLPSCCPKQRARERSCNNQFPVKGGAHHIITATAGNTSIQHKYINKQYIYTEILTKDTSQRHSISQCRITKSKIIYTTSQASQKIIQFQNHTFSKNHVKVQKYASDKLLQPYSKDESLPLAASTTLASALPSASTLRILLLVRDNICIWE